MATVPADLEQVTTLPTGGITSGQTTGHIADHIKISRALQAVLALTPSLSAVGHAHAVADLTDTTDITRTFMKSATVAAARSAIGAQPVGDYATLVSGKIPSAQLPTVTTTSASITDASSTGRSVLTATDATSARSALGAQAAGTYATLVNGTIPTGQLPASAQGGNFRGAWVASTAYSVGDLVTANGSTFRVITAHTSGSTAPTAAVPGTNLALVAAAGAQGPAGTQIIEITEAGYAALTATQRASAFYSITAVDPNLASSVAANLRNGVITDFLSRGSGGTLTATTTDGVGAVLLTAGSGSTAASADVGTGFLVPIEAGKAYTATLTARHVAQWGRDVRVDLVWRDSASGVGNAVGTAVTGTAVSFPSIGTDISVGASGTAPSGATRLEVRFRNATSGPSPAIGGAYALRLPDVRLS